PREPLASLGPPGLGLVRGERRRPGGYSLAALRRDRLRDAAVLLRRFPRPEKSEDDGDAGADGCDDHRIDDQADEDAGNPGREADRVQRRPWGMGPAALMWLRDRDSPLWV